MGDRYFDLGNFSVNNELDESGLAALLEVYFGEEPGVELATLALFRYMSDFREAMWGVVQSGVTRHRLRLQRVRDQALRAHGCDRGRPEVQRLARGGRWPVRPISPTPPAA